MNDTVETHPEYFKGKEEVEKLVSDTINEIQSLKLDIDIDPQLDWVYLQGYTQAIQDIKQLLSINGFPTRGFKND